MQVTLLAHRLHVLSVRAEVVPRMAFPLVRLLAQASAGDRFFSCSRTEEEMTLVMDESLLAQLEADVCALRLEVRPYRAWPQVWVAMQVDQGQAVGDDEECVVFSLSEPMAAESISIYYLSTFDADYCLVELRQLRHAIGVLQAAHEVLLEGQAFFREQLAKEEAASPCKDCSEVPAVKLRMLDCSLSLAKLPTATLPLLASSLLELFLMQPSQLLSYTEVDSQASLVVGEDALHHIPQDIAEEINFYAAAWTPLAVVGPLGFSECGIVRTISGPLLRSGHEIFYLSTFSMDPADRKSVV